MTRLFRLWQRRRRAKRRMGILELDRRRLGSRRDTPLSDRMVHAGHAPMGNPPRELPRDSHPVHHVRHGFGVKREGDTIVYPGNPPGAIQMTLMEWASLIAFTTPAGGNSESFAAARALVEGSQADDKPTRPSSGGTTT